MLGCLSNLQTQGHEVLGSLRGLFLMFYEGVSSRSRSRSRALSNAVGVVGSF